MMTSPATLITGTVEDMYRAEQIDLLHLSAATLAETVESGETDLFLESPHKTASQKKMYASKLVSAVRSPELRTALKVPLAAGDTDFFLHVNLTEFLSDLDHAVEQIEIVRLTVAIEFKEKDVRHLAKLLAKRLDKPIAFDLTVDASLIGGAVIQHGSYISDYSVRTRLKKFREEWKEAVVSDAR